MTERVNCIAIIPARGGSKGIPRKNLRPLAGKPMISYSIEACLQAGNVDRVVVSTDDDEIALIAERFGADVVMRPDELANDVATLDPVIDDAVARAELRFNEQYGTVVTVQPTSPLVRAVDVEAVVARLGQTGADTVMTVVDDRHLCWTVKDGHSVPAYHARVNRQQLPANFRETGAVVACTRAQCATGTRIGASVELQEVPHERSFDIDNYADLYLCEAMLSRRTIVFAVVGYAEVGLGHAFRTVMLANELVKADIRFVLEARSDLAIDYIRQHNYPVEICPDGELVERIATFSPDLVINDLLDTSETYMAGLKAMGCKIVNFEDVAPASRHADLVVNALYPQQLPSKQVLTGARYFCLRDEFIYLPERQQSGEIRRVLLTFGGVDEGDLSCRTLSLIADECALRNIAIDIVVGPGYPHTANLQQVIDACQASVELISKTKRISDYMARADMAITSGGRTVLELAAVGLPTLVICQNQRETTHTFASSENGIINLGYRGEVSDEQIHQTFVRIVDDAHLRTTMLDKVAELDLTKGKDRVIRAITALLP
ncbi:cytidylyltransferase domain-containing protein [Ferrimonas pelagia]|uniref:Glycosyltransferase n=1 Tax=Ferrimonas pelagia TaxID=1177826 RepID=A0ABP9F6C4_9GAMM